MNLYKAHIIYVQFDDKIGELKMLLLWYVKNVSNIVFNIVIWLFKNIS